MTTYVAVASGKGGVGKTAIATNLAYYASQVGKSLLVDLDLQNQGASSLFSQITAVSRSSTFDLLTNADAAAAATPLQEASSNLLFLPAVRWGEPPNQDSLFSTMNSEVVARRFLGLMERVSHPEELDFVIIDCHGGLDLLSCAAFHGSGCTLIVTEPDLVTFSGMLQLIHYYIESHNNVLGHEQEKRNRRQPELKFVVNRIRGDLARRHLDALYTPHFTNLPWHGETKLVFCYMPSDDSFKSYFGEYPFFVEICPTSIISKKIALMGVDLFCPNERRPHDGALRRVSGKRQRRRIENTVKSAGYVAERRAYNFFVGTTVLLLVFAGISAYGITRGLFEAQAGGLNLVASYRFGALVGGGFFIFSGMLSIYFLFVLWSVDRVYKEMLQLVRRVGTKIVQQVRGLYYARVGFFVALRVSFLVLAVVSSIYLIVGGVGLGPVMLIAAGADEETLKELRTLERQLEPLQRRAASFLAPQGAQPPLPEWGAMISTGRQYLLEQWWVATMPGIAIFVVSLGFNLLGDGLRDVLDPKQR